MSARLFRHARRASAVCAIVLLESCSLGSRDAPRGAALAPCPGSARVPMIKWDGIRPAVHVIVDGTGPYLFLIDTGAGGLARADIRLVQALHLERAGEAPMNDGSAAAAAAGRTMPQYVLRQVSFGGFGRSGVPAPGRSYNSDPKRTPIDGILGYGFFAGCPDRRAPRFGHSRASGGSLASRPDAIRYRSDDGGPQVPIRIGSIEGVANLDTGDREGFTLPGAMASRLELSAPPRVVGTGHSANNVFEIRQAPLSGTVHIGRTVWTGPAVTFADAFDNINVGSRVLQDLVVAFDQDRRLVRLSRPGH